MSDEDLFNEIANAKPIGKFADRLAIGKHRLVLKRFAIKKSESEYGRILEADFLVLDSTTEEKMSTKGWAWFVESKGWAGKYEQDRVKDFIAACGACVGDTRGVAEIGAGMKSDRQTGRGLVLDCEVSPQMKKGEVKKAPDGSTYVNIEWKAVQQSIEQVAQYRRELDQLDGPATLQIAPAQEAAPPPAAAAAPPPAAKPFSPPPAGTSLLGRR